MSQYIKVFNTRDEYNEWLSGYTEGYAVSAYIISENATVGKEYTPFLTASADTTSFEYPATSTTLHIKSNLNWTLTKPSWVTVNTSGACAADLTMAIAANDESKNSRSGNVVISYNQTSSQTISLTQAGNPSYTGIPSTEIWYTSTDGNVWTPSGYFKDADGNELTIVSNTYTEGKGVIVLSNEVVSLADLTSYRPYINSVQLPNSVTSLDYDAFMASSLTSVTFGNGVTSIGNRAFYGCTSLSSITIPNSVTSIGNATFSNCSSLSSITIPNSVTSIGSTAFLNINNAVIIVGTGVTSIGGSAFASLTTGLTSLTFLSTTPPTITSDAQFYAPNNYPIYVPAAAVNAYKAASGWSSYASRIQAIPE